MPRSNSTTWSIGDAITSTRLQDYNEDLDDIYSKGSDRLSVYKSAALRITIGAGAYRVGNTEGLYSGGTLTVANNSTTYVMLDSSGIIQTSTSAWDSIYAKIAKVTAAGGTITTIEIWRADLVGGPVGQQTKAERKYITGASSFSITFSTLSQITCVLVDGSGSDTNDSGANSRNAIGQGFYNGTIRTSGQKPGSVSGGASYSDRILQLDHSTKGYSATILNSSLSLSTNVFSGTLTNNFPAIEVCFTSIGI